MARNAVTVYFETPEQVRRLRALAALKGSNASEVAKDVLVKEFDLNAPFFGLDESHQTQKRTEVAAPAH